MKPGVEAIVRFGRGPRPDNAIEAAAVLQPDSAGRQRTPPTTAPGSLNGTFIGDIRGVAYGRPFAMHNNFILSQTGGEVTGAWNTTGGTSGTVNGMLRGNTVPVFHAKQLSPCAGDFIGEGKIDSDGLLQGTYAGNDCNGSVRAAFSVKP
jgi:hypothetical protein